MTNGSSSRQDYFTLAFFSIQLHLTWKYPVIFQSWFQCQRRMCWLVPSLKEERYNRCVLWQVWPAFNVWANFFLVQSSRKWFIFYIGRYIIWMSEDYEAYWDNRFLMGSETHFPDRPQMRVWYQSGLLYTPDPADFFRNTHCNSLKLKGWPHCIYEPIGGRCSLTWANRKLQNNSGLTLVWI